MSVRPLNLQLVIDIITYVKNHDGLVLTQNIIPDGDEKVVKTIEEYFEALESLNVVKLNMIYSEGPDQIAIESLTEEGEQLARIFINETALGQITSQFSQEIKGSELSRIASVGSKILGDLAKEKPEKKAQGKEERRKKRVKWTQKLTVGQAKRRLIDFAKTQIPPELNGVLRINPNEPNTQEIHVLSKNTKEVREILGELERKQVSVRIDRNSNIPGIVALDLYRLPAKLTDALTNYIGDAEEEEYLASQERILAENIVEALSSKTSSVALLISNYIWKYSPNPNGPSLSSTAAPFQETSTFKEIKERIRLSQVAPEEELKSITEQPKNAPPITDKEIPNTTPEINETTEEPLDESLLQDLEDVEKAQEGFLNELTQQTARQDFAKQLEEVEVEEPLAPPQTIENPLQIAELTSDSAHKGKDLLGFEQDVEAFAAIMALEKLTPPLAIALFGQWGTGKSFFMQKLSEKVEELAKYQGFLKEEEEDEEGTGGQSSGKDEKPFCEGVCQIHFNAWSYMDTNLWASLVTRIFEKLDDYINDNRSEAQKEVDTIKSGIAQQLDVAKGQIAELEARKAQVQNAIDTLKGQVETAQGELKGKIEEIKNSSRKEVIKEAIKESKIEESLKGILDKAGISQEKLDQVNPDLILKELKSGQTFVRQFLNYSGWDWGLVGVGAVLLLITTLVLPEITDFETNWLNGIGSALGVLTGVLSKVRGTASKLSPLVNGVLKVKNDYDTAVSEAISKHEQEILAKQIEADQKEVELNQLNLQLKAKEAEIKEIEYKPDSVLAQKAMYNFITRKATSKDYSRHLGIISMIRKDFQTLSELFVESTKATKVPEKSKEKYEEFEKIRKGFDKPLQRIILYIDDLDRCPEERVVEVLEAVNLLMAFPLFVVVVGVDPRWVKNALIKKYHLQFTGHIKGADKAVDSVGMEVINPSDYLEKIFQIPFHLKAPEDESIKEMITHLLGDAVAEKPEVSEEEEQETGNQLPDINLDAFFEEKSREARGLTGEVAELETEGETAKASDPELFDLGVPAMVPLQEMEESAEEAEEAEEETEELSEEMSEEEGLTEESSEETTEDEIPEGLKVVTPDSLRLHWEEGEYMRNLSWLIGNTPRTVKRFVNMYRIIRAHEGLSYEDDESKKDLLSIMFLLALQTGQYYKYSDSVLEAIFSGLGGPTFGEVITIEINRHSNEEIEYKQDTYAEFLNTMRNSETFKQLRDVSCTRIYGYGQFIKRFSFKIVTLKEF